MQCYIFDLDGTLANLDHRLHHIKQVPKDWDAFFGSVIHDAPIPHMVQLCKTLAHRNQIVFVSGRSERCRADTVAWLRKHVGFCDVLYMRKDRDFRDDSIVKRQILGHMIDDGYEPIMAFDDRSRVVAMWRKANVPCLQVAPGDF